MSDNDGGCCLVTIGTVGALVFLVLVAGGEVPATAAQVGLKWGVGVVAVPVALLLAFVVGACLLTAARVGWDTITGKRRKRWEEIS